MNKIPDKYVMIVIVGTILVVFAFIFSVKSPERKIIDSPILWKNDFSTLLFINNKNVELKEIFPFESYIL